MDTGFLNVKQVSLPFLEIILPQEVLLKALC